MSAKALSQIQTDVRKLSSQITTLQNKVNLIYSILQKYCVPPTLSALALDGDENDVAAKKSSVVGGDNSTGEDVGKEE